MRPDRTVAADVRRPWSPWHRLRDPGHIGVVLVVFVVSRAAFIAGGLNFRANPPGQIQLLDLNELRADPFVAFTSLHIQPPLFNFFVGAVLRWSPFPAGVSFQVLYLLAGLVTVLCVWSLVRSLGAKAWIATAATIVVVLDPLLIRDESALTYETWVALLLAVTAWSADRYFRRPDLGRFVALLAVLVVGVLTRTTLNPLWLIGAVVLAMVMKPPRVRHRTAAVAVVVALACITVPLVHNKVRFDTLGFSSYAGMNLDRITVLQLPQHRLDQLIREGKVSPVAAVRPYSAYGKYAEYFPKCDPRNGNAALDDFEKGDSGRVNLNNVCFLPVYRQSLRDAFAVIRNEPGVYLQAVGVASKLYVGWDDYTIGTDSRLWHDWESIYGTAMLRVPVAYQFGHADPLPYPKMMLTLKDLIRFSITILLALALVLIQGLRGAGRLVRGRGDDSTRSRVFIAFMVLALSVVSVAFDTFENARFREPLDPLLLGLLTMWVLQGADGLVARRRSRLPEGV